jgi:hypothetical protein
VRDFICSYFFIFFFRNFFTAEVFLDKIQQ